MQPDGQQFEATAPNEMSVSAGASQNAKMKPPKTKLLIVAAITAALISGAYAYHMWRSAAPAPAPTDITGDYVIPGVPYFGAYNYTGDASLLNSEIDAGMMTIYEYWYPGRNDFEALTLALSVDAESIEENRAAELEALEEQGELTNAETAQETEAEPEDGEEAPVTINEYYFILDDLGYSLPQLGRFSTRWELYDWDVQLLKIEDLKQYINPEVRTPLYTYMHIVPDEEESIFTLAPFILIGIKESTETLVFHSYWLGGNYEISFEEFNVLSGNNPETNGHPFLVVHPEDGLRRMGALVDLERMHADFTYPPREEALNEAEDIMNRFAIAVQTLRFGDTEEDIAAAFESVLESPGYDKLPQSLKVETLSLYAETLLLLGETETALRYAEEAVALNANLDRTHGGWPGVEFAANEPARKGEMYMPHRILGDIHGAREEWKDARNAYSEALAINPDDQPSIAGLAFAEEQI